MSLLDRRFGDVLIDVIKIVLTLFGLFMVLLLFPVLLIGTLVIELLVIFTPDLRGKTIKGLFNGVFVHGVCGFLKALENFLSGEPFDFEL